MRRRVPRRIEVATACVVLAACVVLDACAGSGPSSPPLPTATATATESRTRTPTVTLTVTLTSTPTSSPTRTVPPSPSRTSTASPTPSATATPTAAPAAIAFVSALPATIYAAGAGGPTQSVVTFRVTDAVGLPVAGIPVDFSLFPVADAAIAPMHAVTDRLGNAQVTLSSGRQSTAVMVTASVATKPTLTARSIAINVMNGLASRLALAHAFHNISGRVTFGLTDITTAFVADQDGIPVPEGQMVNFVTNGGEIMLQTTTDALGAARATLVSTKPLPANGIAATLATLRGARPFTDVNGNAVCDGGVDVVHAAPEPFFDDNCNGIHEDGEGFIDLNNNGTFDADQGEGTCADEVIISASICTTFSGGTQVAVTPSAEGPIPAGGSADFTLVVSDDLNNPIVGGSTVTLSLQGSRGRLVGPAVITIPDAITFNQLVDNANRFHFSVVDNDPTAATGETDVLVVTVRSENLPAGGNGSRVVTAQITFLGAAPPVP